MTGAMSHLDTFDPKPGAKSQGETKPGKTRVPGIQITDKMPKLSYLMNEIALCSFADHVDWRSRTGQLLDAHQLHATQFDSPSWTRRMAAHALPKKPRQSPVERAHRFLRWSPSAGFFPPRLPPFPFPIHRSGSRTRRAPVTWRMINSNIACRSPVNTIRPSNAPTTVA